MTLVRSLVACFAFFLAKAAAALAPAPLPDGATVKVNGATLWYWTEGHGEPLLIVEGGPGAAGYLDPFLKELADQFTVIHFRGLGRGKSDRAAKSSDYSFDRDIADIEGFRQALDLGAVNLFGHSYGGMLVTGYALRHPQAVKRLMISEGLFSAEMWQAGSEYGLESMRLLYPDVWDQVMTLRARGLRSNAPECQALMAQISEAVFYLANESNVGKTPNDLNPEVYYAIAGADADFHIGGSIAGLDFRAGLKTLTMPLLITTARFDRVVLPRFSREYRTYAPQAEIVMFEKSGHNLFLEEHEKFIATVRTFFTKPIPAAR